MTSRSQRISDRLDRIGRRLDLFGKKYNPNQPREPRGVPVGGRWSSAGVRWGSEAARGPGWKSEAQDTREWIRAGNIMRRAKSEKARDKAMEQVERIGLRQGWSPFVVERITGYVASDDYKRRAPKLNILGRVRDVMRNTDG